ncbi:hypothetical protein [Erythrobacter sp.]|uniref:hypothetical protein n=1 Tax=Erythrobacter sp. TaxID=1042 RepID=UPI0025F92D18|nr:hypothetical protein [Erythrobacter sp.]
MKLPAALGAGSLAALVAGAVMLTALGDGQPLAARENQVVKCKTGKARKAPGYAGAALVANVPRSMTPIDLNAVQFADKALTRDMVVEGLFARRTETDTVEVSARFVNCTKRALTIRARSSFMDDVQYPVEPSSAWQRVIIQPYATGVYRERSMKRDEVKYYLIEIAGE